MMYPNENRFRIAPRHTRLIRGESAGENVRKILAIHFLTRPLGEAGGGGAV